MLKNVKIDLSLENIAEYRLKYKRFYNSDWNMNPMIKQKYLKKLTRYHKIK